MGGEELDGKIEERGEERDTQYGVPGADPAEDGAGHHQEDWHQQCAHHPSREAGTVNITIPQIANGIGRDLTGEVVIQVAEKGRADEGEKGESRRIGPTHADPDAPPG